MTPCLLTNICMAGKLNELLHTLQFSMMHAGAPRSTGRLVIYMFVQIQHGRFVPLPLMWAGIENFITKLPEMMVQTV